LTYLKPDIQTPRYTICYYKLNFSGKFTGYVYIFRDVNTEVTLRSSSDGEFSDLSSSDRRMLGNVPRNLDVNERYSATDSDYIEIYYGVNYELTNSTLGVSSFSTTASTTEEASPDETTSSNATLIFI
jgi:hypothetical protein